MPTHLEIEKRYLVDELPDLSGLKSVATIDVYFPEVSDHARLRARHQGDVFELTKKTRQTAENGYVMVEQTIELTQVEFDFLSGTSTRRIEKTRFYIPHGEHLIELDVFGDKLTGLIIAEVEFQSEQDLALFEKPTWLGREIDDEEVLAGGVLSGRTFEEVVGVL